MPANASLEHFMMLESIVEGWLETALSDYTGYDWRSFLNSAEDVGNSYYMIVATNDGSQDTLAPQSSTNTGSVERDVFNFSINLELTTTPEEVMRSAKVNQMNLHQRKVAQTRAGMLMGNLANAAPCPITSVIGQLTIGGTQFGVNDEGDFITNLQYSFLIGYRKDAWPAAPSP